MSETSTRACVARRVGLGLELFLVADDARNFRHRGKARRIDLRGAAGDDDLRVRTLAAGAADGLARLAHGFVGDGAGVDDDGAAHAAAARQRTHGFAFRGVQPAAKRDDIDALVSVILIHI